MPSRSLRLAVLSVAVSACGNNAIGTGASGGSGGDGAGVGGVNGVGGVTGAAGAGAVPGTGGGNAGSGGDASGAGGAVTTGGTSGGAGSGGAAAAGPWVMGYWAVWQTKQYPLAHVAWSDMTHAAISFVGPRAPGATSSASPYATLDSSNAVDNLGATGMSDFAAAARTGGAHPILSLGGAGAGAGFAAAASPTNQKQFVSEVVAACAKWKYDGVDLDWEDRKWVGMHPVCPSKVQCARSTEVSDGGSGRAPVLHDHHLCVRADPLEGLDHDAHRLVFIEAAGSSTDHWERHGSESFVCHDPHG